VLRLKSAAGKRQDFAMNAKQPTRAIKTKYQVKVYLKRYRERSWRHQQTTEVKRPEAVD
jgi:hypothetical protein